MDRRRFVAALGGATAGLALGGVQAACRTTTGGNGIAPLGLQLYTVRSLMERSVADTLASVAAAGYREVELAGLFGHDPADFRALLERNELTAPSGHVSLDSLEGDGLAPTLAAARTLGHRYLVVAWVPPEQRRTLEDWRRIAQRLERAGAAVQDAGLTFAYHNHDFELQPLEGTVPLDIVTATDPDLVAIELDLYWVRKGGSDALTWLRRHPGRFPLVHVKDMAEDGGFADVGHGVIDWPAIFAHADTAGIRHYFVEHDQPADPLESIRRSYRYLSALAV